MSDAGRWMIAIAFISLPTIAFGVGPKIFHKLRTEMAGSLPSALSFAEVLSVEIVMVTPLMWLS